MAKHRRESDDSAHPDEPDILDGAADFDDSEIAEIEAKPLDETHHFFSQPLTPRDRTRPLKAVSAKTSRDEPLYDSAETLPLPTLAEIEAMGKSGSARGDARAGQFPGFEIKGELGRGGVGAVYLAHEEAANRDIALKTFSPGGGERPNPAQRARFVEEAAITAQLQHPGIVPIYRIGRDARGEDYYSMRPIEGHSLERILAGIAEGHEAIGREYPLKRLIRILHQVCQTLMYAHSRGVVHRDIKPANIVVGDFGEILLIDWGMAKVVGRVAGAPKLEEEGFDEAPSGIWKQYQREVQSVRDSGRFATDTVDGTILGTPAYMSPEQAGGARCEHVFATDIWSLGVTLYEIAVGKLPFGGKNIHEMIKEIRTQPLPDPAQANPQRTVPAEIACIIRRCLKKDPAERYPTITALADDLEAWLEGAAPWTCMADVDFSKLNMEEFARDWETTAGEWSIEKGVLEHCTQYEGCLLLRRPVGGDVRVEIIGEVEPGQVGELSVLLNAPAPALRKDADDGYCLQFGADYNMRGKLAKNAIDITNGEGVLTPGQSHTVVAERIGNLLRLEADNAEIFRYRDYIPLTGEHVGLYTYGVGTRIRRFRVFSRGVSLMQSCLETPNTLYNEGEYELAKKHFLRIAHSHPDREEGQEALFLAGRCCVKRAEADPEHAEDHYAEAMRYYDTVKSGSYGPLGSLGASTVYALLGDIPREIEELGSAYKQFRGNRQLAPVGEHLWARVADNFLGQYGSLTVTTALTAAPEALVNGNRWSFLNDVADRAFLMTVLKGLLRRHSREIWLRFNLMLRIANRCYFDRNEPVKARRVLKKIRTDFPEIDVPGVQMIIGMTYAAEQRWDKALGWFQKANQAARESDNPNVSCWASFASQRVAYTAMGEIRRAEQLEPKLLELSRTTASIETDYLAETACFRAAVGDYAGYIEYIERVSNVGRNHLRHWYPFFLQGAALVMRNDCGALGDLYRARHVMVEEPYAFFLPWAFEPETAPDDLERWIHPYNRFAYEWSMALAAFYRDDTETAVRHLRNVGECCFGSSWFTFQPFRVAEYLLRFLGVDSP